MRGYWFAALTLLFRFRFSAFGIGRNFLLAFLRFRGRNQRTRQIAIVPCVLPSRPLLKRLFSAPRASLGLIN